MVVADAEKPSPAVQTPLAPVTLSASIARAAAR
jgi:hypothetical protein